jgi:hypothetical protein
LTYIFCVLTNIYERKATMSDPKAFKDKIKSIERAWKNQGKLKRTLSGQSGISGAMSSVKSFKTGSEFGETIMSGEEGDEVATAAGGSHRTYGLESDPVFVGI